MRDEEPGKLRVRAWLVFSLGAAFTCLVAGQDPSAGDSDCVLCRQCGADVSDSDHLFNHLSPTALLRGNQSLFGKSNVQTQLLQNPLGIRFQVVTFAKAHCALGNSWHNEFSWFPGHVWRHCLCPKCGHHLGWVFIPQTFAAEKAFYALILDNVLSEQFSDSLMVIPKAYQS